jgi:hypothetical protein
MKLETQAIKLMTHVSIQSLLMMKKSLVFVDMSLRPFCLFIVFGPSHIYERTPLPVKGCKLLALYIRRPVPLSREESVSCHTRCDTALGCSLSHSNETGGCVKKAS